MKLKTNGHLIVSLLVALLAMPLLGQGAEGQIHPAPPAARATSADLPLGNATPPSSHDKAYIIGNDDRLSINVWKEPDLTQTVPVRSDGKITLPLIGDIQASGRTPEQLQAVIAAKLLTYMTHPEVTVIVMQINSQKFNILGRVTKPGSYTLTTSTTVLDAIADAGGFQDFAKTKKVYILRDKPNTAEERIAFNYKDVIQGKHPEENIRLQAGDTVVVP